eukprot:2470481-Pleurochrysis_carterae.AAC.1
MATDAMYKLGTECVLSHVARVIYGRVRARVFYGRGVDVSGSSSVCFALSKPTVADLAASGSASP